ncbi:MAG: DUF2892 domain-containing protein, partial [Zetaproteobacteria bacterium]
NVGGVDRIVRMVLGVILAVVGVLGLLGQIALGTTAAWVLIVIGAVLFGTALIRFCPLYLPFGINTAKNEK